MFTVRIWMDELDIDPALLYNGSRGTKYTHVQRLLLLNKAALMLLHPLEQLDLGIFIKTHVACGPGLRKWSRSLRQNRAPRHMALFLRDGPFSSLLNARLWIGEG